MTVPSLGSGGNHTVNQRARGEGDSDCRWAGNLIVADQVFSRFVGWDELVLLKPRASPGTMSSSSQTTTTHALLAQLAEQLTLNQRVVGSSPTGGTHDRMRIKPTGCVISRLFQGQTLHHLWLIRSRHYVGMRLKPTQNVPRG